MLLRHTVTTEHEKDREILFYKIQAQTSALLSELLYSYSMQREQLLQKHKEVQRYLESAHPLDVDLKNIHEIINENRQDNPYNIYITDTNLIIENSTFLKDIGFDLSFAKASFDAHFEQNITGICTPLFEKSSKEFLTYTDSYLMADGGGKSGVLQVSYTYKKSAKRLRELKDIISKYPSIVDAKAYILVDDGFVNDIILKGFESYKPDIEEILTRMKDGAILNEQLLNQKLIVESFTQDNISYTQMNIATQSPIFENTKIIYSILLDNSKLEATLKKLNLIIFFVILLGVVAIFITSRLRKKEIKLSEQDKFVQSSIHEIKTPLSIITLNNELRELEFGRDEYSTEIESAIKILKTSYDDMSFTLTKDELSYPLEILPLEEILQERVSYFKSIATSKHKVIKLDMNGVCHVEISKAELIRLIDNNLSNAIKYSSADSTISVLLNENLLTFHNMGKPIQDKKNIFTKYVRENNIIGGHGLGLSIVDEIAQKYEIRITLTSTEQEGTTFLYVFKCHTSDISMVWNF